MLQQVHQRRSFVALEWLAPGVHNGDAHLDIAVGKPFDQERFPHRIQFIQDFHGLATHERRFRTSGRAQRIDQRGALKVIIRQQAPRGVARPTIRGLQQGHQLRRTQRRQRRGAHTTAALLGRQTPDAAGIQRLFQLALHDLLAQEARHEVLVLQHTAMHVDDVQRTIRPITQTYRTKALVRRGQDFAVRVHTLGLEPEASTRLRFQLQLHH